MNTMTPSRLHWPSLTAGLVLMLAGTAYPLVFAHADGRADHGLALLLFWAMSAGFVRGVGFIPRRRALRLLLSGWACLAALAWGALSLAIRTF
ncbi:MAG TPA: cyd operon YbgE family protein [Roseateles sp.]|uniref:cyd operon YbgE family protein n=1 Tax=Roseateles sp. TaxID=1971397 RepID=UPI002ED9CFB7